MISIVSYGIGNVQAIYNIYKRLNIPVQLVKTSDDLCKADKIILPGVGSFDWAMSRLENSGMRACLDDLVFNNKCQVLGICVGMQMLAKSSDEGAIPGLGWINAEVKHFTNKHGRQQISLPHMGWNDVSPIETKTLFKELEISRFYFLHSYYFQPFDDLNILASTDYHGSFASAVHVGNIFGVQFHPEKSHQWGIQLFKNFAEL